MQGLEERRVLAGGATRVLVGAAPVAPVGDVLEALVVAAVLHVFGAEHAGAAAGVDDVVERDLARLLSVLDHVGGGDGPAGVQHLLAGLAGREAAGELDRPDLDAVPGLGAVLGRVLEHQVV